MSKDEYKKLVSIEIKKFINKRIEIRRIYKELQQIKNNILYLKEKYGQEITEGFQTENGKLSISKYKSEFSSRLKKEFKDLSIEEKRKLYKSGLLTILFRLNYSKYEKLKKENQKTPLDEYAIKRDDIQPYRWNVQLTEKTKDELSGFEQDIKRRFDLKSFDAAEEVEKQLNNIEDDRFKTEDEIEKEQELIREQLEEMGIETDLDEITPDVYEAMIYDLIEIEDEDDDEDDDEDEKN
jgi:hypothetical protein|tara:strand:+ start:62 stop:775 length:714 start_codon:yes stop_codon:yes gene_type:complete